MIELQEKSAGQAAKEAGVPFHVKKIGHVVYRASDIERTAKFWTEVMGFKESDRNEQGMVFLRCQSDHHTVALSQAAPDAKLASGKDRSSLGIDHFAMEVESVEDLFRARDFLKSKGVTIVMEGRRGPGSNMGVEFLDPDGYMLELYVGMEQIGWEGKSRPPQFWRRAKSLEEAVSNPCPAE